MPLQRLRRVLEANLSVTIDSSAATIQLVQEKIAARVANCRQKNRTPPPVKTPTAILSLSAVPSVVVRPIDLLRKIGDLTTPSEVNMASLSASWATRRYFWAIAEPQGANARFKLSLDARAMDFHQKTLLSDEFGIGFAGLMLERLFGTSRAIDVSEALKNPGDYQDVGQSGLAQPDYLMWGTMPTGPYYVVECKGCQTRRDATMNQIRRGLEQVPGLVFGTGARPVTTLVVATLMQASQTVVYIVDPPTEPPDEKEPSKEDSISERVDKNTWRIRHPEEFSRNARLARQARLLNWAGQFASAANTLAKKREPRFRTAIAPDLKLQRRRIAGLDYYGRRVPLFRELGAPRLRVFTGVQEDVLASAREGGEEPAAEPTNIPVALTHDQMLEPNQSLGADGTCLVVEGL